MPALAPAHPAADPAPPSARTERRAALGVLLAVVGGAGVIALQSRINGSLADHVASGYLAAVVSFGSGLILLSLALLISRRSRRGMHRLAAALRTRALRPWQVLGGAAGGFFVAGQGLTVGVLGVATFFIVAFVTGQSLGSVVVDRLGPGPGGVRLVTFPAPGPALTVIAVDVVLGPRR